jgi:hypothetical protein
MKNKKLIKVYGIIISTLLIFSFNESVAQHKQELNNEIESIDYSNLNHWAAHPMKIDLSDSNTVVHKHKEIKAQVFFIHPTSYSEPLIDNEWNANIDDSMLNRKTDYSSILYQSTAFKNQTEIFAPRYRQANIKAFYITEVDSDVYFDIAYDDIKNAFEYFLKIHNNGMPIVIASHSQGTKHAGRLLKEYFEGKELKEKLVCAYIIGMPIPTEYFKDLKVCESSTETGCFVGWRTYKTGYVPEEVKNEKFESVVVNPLNWKTDKAKIDKQKNLGGILKNYKKLVPGVVDAEIKGNILWSCKPDVFGKLFFFHKNFHIGDINLFYKNLNIKFFSFL